ncbi:MAG: peptidylprolyl isomerase [Gemmatimonadota bacterium]|nr:peptidylprolyl isomerase [Gemmatimonadota bacterium]
MSQAKKGDTVHVHYTGRLEDGTVFDSSDGRDPLEFTLGEGRVIQGFEDAVSGLSVGATTETRIPPEMAYGHRSEEMVLTIPRGELPDDMDPAVGDVLEMTTEDGQSVPVAVTVAAEDSIEVDANHPLAGKVLIFDLELVKIL